MKKLVGALLGTALALAAIGVSAPSADAGSLVANAAHSSAQKAALQSTKLTVTRKKFHAHQWRVNVHLTKAGHPWSHKVTLQIYGQGVWVYASSVTTGAHGNFTVTTKPGWGTSYPMRMHVAATKHSKGANSRTFHLPVR